ncbi:MAG TPA: hypothetical protein VJQ79_06485 [Acidimicrobiia bacterium]|nr:hypothetical protein [Acidimicrobiia bacterium]
MQFKGSVRAPGDKDPGVRVVLDIDEYHLEIRRDSELIGRYYLADVEVARDIAERFILFLGDDEVEFLADDALQFAYGGVTAMQDGWLSAQKRKRRHRRAAEDAARRKDGERPVEIEAPARPVYVSDSDTIRSRRRQVAGNAPDPAAPQRTATAPPAAPITQAPPEKRADRRERKEVAAAKVTPPVEVAGSSPPAEEEAPVPPIPVAKSPQTPEPIAPAKPAAAGRRSRGGRAPASVASRPGDSSSNDHEAVMGASRTEPAAVPAAPGPAAAVPAAPQSVAAATEPEVPVDTSLAARRRKITDDAKPKGPDDLGRVRVPEPVTGRTARDGRTEASATLVETTRAKVAVDGEDVRFAQQGHHPSETSTGLLSKLRRQPKLPDNHVHKFKESGSSVGLIRRVCTECAYVSIGSDDD